MARYLNKPYYENICFEDSDGDKIFYCNSKRAQWYLDRNLAEVVSESPMVLRLKFKPKGKGYHGDEYHLDKKINQCVVCGSKKELTRHHVVPKMYRKHFPENIKSKNCYDILLMCVKHHDVYETLANELKNQIAVEYDCPLLGDGWHFDLDLLNVKKSASALLKEGIPPCRRRKLTSVIKNYYNKEITDNEIQMASKINPIVKSQDYREHGSYVVNQLNKDEIIKFIRMWRNHFIKSMNPKFLPRYWDVKKEIFR